MSTKKPYVVKCLNARYDAEEGVLILVCFFEEFGGQRLVHFNKSDFHYKHPNNEVPDNEMHRTADMFKGKKFKLIIEDDPSRNVQVDNKIDKEHDILKTVFNREESLRARIDNMSFGV